MVQRTPLVLAELYEADETAWLEGTAELVRAGRFDALDAANLAEFLTDMAKRDRREVYSRLVVLLTHLLKWEYQQDKRSGSWRDTILEQRSELRQMLTSGTLRNHAATVLADAYAEARLRAEAQTGLPLGTFPEEFGSDLAAVLTDLGEG